MTALVTCGQTRAGLAAVRSLGRAGIAVAVGAPRRPSLAMWSRYATATFLTPDPSVAPEHFFHVISEELRGRGAVVALAGSNAAWWALSRWRDALPATAQRVLPPHDALARAADRGALHDLAESLGLPCLQTLRVDARSSVEPALRAARRLGMPALVRPLVAVSEGEGGLDGSAEAIPVSSIADLRRLLYARQDLVEGGCLIEPRPPGRTFGYGAVCEAGVPLVEVFQERLRERKPLSGVATLAETVAPDPEVREVGRRLLGALNWQGPAMIEMVRSSADGTLRVVAVVGRLWGSVQLAVRAGIDIPRLCVQLAEGKPLSGPRIARAGVRFRWVLGDLQRTLSTISMGKDPLTGRIALARRAKAVMEFADLRLARHIATDVLDPDDPMPFVYEVQDAVRLPGLGS